MNGYGLSLHNPVRVAPQPRTTEVDPTMADVLAAARGKAAKDVFLQALRCPSNREITWVRHGSHMGANMKPVDQYSIECKCRCHSATIYIDAYSTGPREPIGIPGWLLADGPDEMPAAEKRKTWWQKLFG